MKTRIFSLVIVAIFFISTTGFAQQNRNVNGHKMDAKKKEMMMKRHVHKKSVFQNFFTEEQRETMKNMRMETAKKVKPLRNELRELMAHQKTLTTADNADLKDINKNIDKLSDVKAKIAKLSAAQHQQVRSLLTDEQLMRFDYMKGKHGKSHKRNNMDRIKRKRI